jgi:hypothetical protein
MILTAIWFGLVASGQQKSPSVKTGCFVAGQLDNKERREPSLLAKSEAGLLRLNQRFRVVSFSTSSAMVETAASNALTSAFTGIDMVFHLLFEENCGLQLRNSRLM